MDRLRQRADFLAVAGGPRTNSPAFVVQSRARGDDFAATRGGGAGAEAVTALAHQLARLIGPFHGSETPLVLGAEGFG